MHPLLRRQLERFLGDPEAVPPEWRAFLEAVDGVYQTCQPADPDRPGEAPQMSDEELRGLFTAMTDLVMVLDGQGRYLKVAPAGAHLLYRPAAELIGKSLDDIFPVVRAEIFRDHIRRALETRQTVQAEYSLPISGVETWFVATISPLREDTVAWVARDITARKRAEAKLERRARQLAALSAMGQTVAGSLDLDVVLHKVVAEVPLLVGADAVSVLLLDDDRDELVFAAVSGSGTEILQGRRMPATVGIAGEVVRTGRSLHVPATANPAQIYREIEQFIGYHTGALLAVPLQLRGEVIGVMEAVHTLPEAFDEDGLRLLESAASWTAIAIGNAWLFAEVKEALAREHRLNEVARAISGTLDLPTILQDVTRLAAELVGADAASLALIEPGNQTLLTNHVFNLPEALMKPMPRGRGVAWHVVESGHSMLLPDYAAHPSALAEWVEAGVQGFIGVPLVAGDSRVGALGMFALSPAKKFTDRDRALAESVGRQIGIAVRNAQLYAAERRRVAALTALRDTGLDLSTQLDLPRLLSAITERAARLAGARMGGIFLLQPDGKTLELAVSYNMPDDLAGLRQVVGEGLFGTIVHTGQPVLVGNYVEWLAPGVGIPFRSVAAAPLMWQGRALGALLVSDNRTDLFNASDLELVALFADQAAVAMVNAQQHGEIRRRLQESEAMLSISRALGETLDLERVWQMIVEAAQRIIPRAERVVIHLLDEEKQALRPVAVTGTGRLAAREFTTMRSGEGIAGMAIAEGRTMNVRDIRMDSRYLPLSTAGDLRSLLVALIQSGGRRLGTLSVLSSQPHAFSADDERLLTTLGLQAALAIENARLFESTQQSLKEMNALYQISRGIAASLDGGQLLHQVATLLHEKFDYDVHIYLLDLANDRLVLRQGSGEGVTELIRRGHEVPRGVDIVGHVAASGQSFLTNEAPSVPLYLSNPLLPDVRSVLAVPLQAGGKVLGVIALMHAPPRTLGERDLNLMTAVADQLAVMLQQAKLYTDLQTALRHEQAARAQLVQSEKLAAMGRLVASVAHELNNPLQAIQNALYLVNQESTLSPQAHDDLRVALTEADRMAELIGRLRETYRPATSQDFLPVSLNALVEAVQRLIGTHLRHNNVKWEFHPDPALPTILAVRDQLKQAVLNLSLNAVEAMPTGGQLSISTRRDPGGQGVWLTVADTGMGIEPGSLTNIFEPFFTTKGSGTGLGLAITYEIIQRHGGTIVVSSRPHEGSRFEIWLPDNPMQRPVSESALQGVA